MENLVIEKTSQSPELKFESNGNLLIKGVCNMNHCKKFYEPAFVWLNEFIKTKPAKINLILEVYYFNTSGSLILVEMLRLLKTFKEMGTELHIVWRYEEEDEDIFDLGEDIQVTTKLDFQFEMIEI